MDEQQLTHPEEIQWYERQKQLSHSLASEEPAQMATALELFVDQHAQLHSPNGLAQSALAGLSDEQWRLKPGQGTNSVAWLLLHIPALRAYWSTVGKTTQDLARTLHPATLKERPEPRNIQRLFDEGAVTPQLAELAQWWEQQTKGVLLFQPVSRHAFWHLHEIRQVRERFPST